MNVRDFTKRLEDNGWRLARKGQPSAVPSSIEAGNPTVAGHPSVDIPPGTLNNILKQAGLK
jgi:predicted RNA binding protein YcfA (HicA-like mRNA interferase family)